MPDYNLRIVDMTKHDTHILAETERWADSIDGLVRVLEREIGIPASVEYVAESDDDGSNVYQLVVYNGDEYWKEIFDSELEELEGMDTDSWYFTAVEKKNRQQKELNIPLQVSEYLYELLRALHFVSIVHYQSFKDIKLAVLIATCELPYKYQCVSDCTESQVKSAVIPSEEQVNLCQGMAKAILAHFRKYLDDASIARRLNSIDEEIEDILSNNEEIFSFMILVSSGRAHPISSED